MMRLNVLDRFIRRTFWQRGRPTLTVRIQAAVIGLVIGPVTAALFSTPLISSTAKKQMPSKDPWNLQNYYRSQLEEAMHHFGESKDYAEQQYWSGYGAAMKAAFTALKERLDHDLFVD